MTATAGKEAAVFGQSGSPIAMGGDEACTKLYSALAGFETGESWSGTNTAANTDKFKEGAQSWELNPPQSSSATATSASPRTSDIDAYANHAAIHVLVFIPSSDDLANLSDLEFRIGSTTPGTNYFEAHADLANFRVGWNIVEVAKSLWSSNGAPDWSNIVQLQVIASAGGGGAAQVIVDDWYIRTPGTPYGHPYQVTDSAKRYIDPDTAVTVKKATVTQTTGFTLVYLSGFVLWDDLLDVEAITVNGSYFTLLQVARARGWTLSDVTQMLDSSVFGDENRLYYPGLAGATGTLERVYFDQTLWNFLQNKNNFILALYVDLANSLRFETIVHFNQDDLTAAVEDLITENLQWTADGPVEYFDT